MQDGPAAANRLDVSLLAAAPLFGWQHVAVIISEQLHTTVQLYLFCAAPEENRRGSWVLAQGRSHGSCHRNEISERDFHPKPRYPR